MTNISKNLVIRAMQENDWESVAHQIENVYGMVTSAGEKVSLGSDLRGWMRSN